MLGWWPGMMVGEPVAPEAEGAALRPQAPLSALDAVGTLKQRSQTQRTEVDVDRRSLPLGHES